MMKETQPILDCQLSGGPRAKISTLPSSSLGLAMMPFGPYDPADPMVLRPRRSYGINYVKIFKARITMQTSEILKKGFVICSGD